LVHTRPKPLYTLLQFVRPDLQQPVLRGSHCVVQQVHCPLEQKLWQKLLLENKQSARWRGVEARLSSAVAGGAELISAASTGIFPGREGTGKGAGEGTGTDTGAGEGADAVQRFRQAIMSS
jgi:hypothetical protein